MVLWDKLSLLRTENDSDLSLFWATDVLSLERLASRTLHLLESENSESVPARALSCDDRGTLGRCFVLREVASLL